MWILSGVSLSVAVVWCRAEVGERGEIRRASESAGSFRL